MRGETDEAFTARMEAKMERAHYFARLELAAVAPPLPVIEKPVKVFNDPKPPRVRKPPKPAGPGRIGRPPLYTRCSECQRGFRPSAVSLSERPDTVVHESHGLCRGCSRRLKR